MSNGFRWAGNCLEVDRASAEKLMFSLHCLNVGQWDAGSLVQRLRRIGVFGDVYKIVKDPDSLALAEAILNLPDGGLIVLRSSDKPTGKLPPPVEERQFVRRSPGQCRKRRRRKRGPLFSFEACGIPVGGRLVFRRDNTIECTVLGDPWKVSNQDGPIESFSQWTKDLIGAKETTYLSPMGYWEYKGVSLRWYYDNVQCDKEEKKGEDDGKVEECSGDVEESAGESKSGDVD